jgi:hypothetical protein
MLESSERQVALVKDVAAATSNLDPAAQAAAMTAVISPPGVETTKTLWIILVGGLVGILLVALIGLIYLLADDIDGTDVILTVFSSALAGLLGLFSRSPVAVEGK